MRTETEIKYDEKLELKKKEMERASAWRVFLPKIDLKKCEKNYRCLIFCPHDAIDIRKDGYPSVDTTKCTGCLICLRECPTSAINEERE